MRRLILSLLLLALVSLACGESITTPTPTCLPSTASVEVKASSRPFHMGFTRWPPAATLEAISSMNQFIASHADLTAIHMDGGVPWPEALTNGDYPSAVMQDWKGNRAAIPANHKLYVAITALNLDRSGLAPYWNKQTNQPLPAPWDGYPLNHPDVKTAYLNYALRVVDYFHPDYFAIGIEVNIAQVKSEKTWEAYKELHQFVYEGLKAKYPDLTVFASVTLSHLSGRDGGDLEAQKKAVTDLMQFSDLLALSAYPYGWMYPSGKADPIPEEFFDIALQFKKPIAVAESGAPTQDFSAFGTNYHFTQAYQDQWIDLLMRKAVEYKFVFVVNWASMDFDRLLIIMPDQQTRELASIWAYTGLQRGDGCNKLALLRWDAYLKLPYIVSP